jgi:hypothetical protein
MNSTDFRFFRVRTSTLPGLFFLLSGASVLSQGTVIFANRVVGELITHVYLGGDHQISGNGPNDIPGGTQDWTGFTGLLGTGYTAQLWAADGPNQPESSLEPVLPTTTFQTAAAGAGFLTTGGLVQLPGVPVGDVATITLRVWDNRGGTVTSWAMAQARGVPLGESPLFNSLPVRGLDPPGPMLYGLVSFNIYQVPEPSALALVGLGMVVCWLGRSRREA